MYMHNFHTHTHTHTRARARARTHTKGLNSIICTEHNGTM